MFAAVTVVRKTCPLVEEFGVTCHLIQFVPLMCVLSLSLFLSLRPLDVEFMRRLSKVVNIVPVIAKADTLTLEERDFFKKKVASSCCCCFFSSLKFTLCFI